MNQVKIQSTRKTTAPGQYLGYSLQQLRLCHHLLRLKADYQVSLELLDDIAVHTPCGRLLLEQCKSVSSTNAVADRAIDLWKTFANWADLCKQKKINAAETDFRLYVTPDASPALAAELSNAKTSDSIAVALEKIKKIHKTGKQAAAVDAHIARFLAAGDVVDQAIIQNFALVIDKNPDESVKGLLHLSVSEQVLDDIAAAVIGMARDRIDNLIRKGLTPIIAAPDFQNAVRAFIRKNNLANLLISKSAEPSREDISSHLNASPIFVRQLQSVEASPDLLTTAIGDWLKATADKIYWASEGHVFASSFQEFDAALIRKHKLVRDEVEDTFSEKAPEQRGREVYRRCANSIISLEGNEVPDHFVAGSYNCLADSSKLGWHPEYAKLFPQDESA
ncbi:ABC-three component system protein [Bradyrhizobium japonicum]|uniref:ABC-three component system protein n=1 Tax=Bradyrhizobium japonicum TaxID=375 RepID=UPI00209E1729|nr:ABC-three component system protein [Bradyrhizobium japonicum]MCP1768656.1 hypothetical protein [Bradyrhizobium japonicum]MCP1794326.1 hypothetical protein [Bradyrhizobium japonicum]MCP1810918.1 hypothetical protein [Bradyrhizobium japonicum]MCP1821229.1 hypothetical protein [Bradyrhizobium japonicum]MCP1876265.1 hypothetical protein [Bradyrhizobium japonicum]